MKKTAVFLMFFLVLAVVFQPWAEAYTVSYKQAVTAGEGAPAMNMRVWAKDRNIRVESDISGQKGVMIIRPDGIYNYLPLQNIVMKIPQAEQQFDYVGDSEKYMQFLNDQGAKKTGSEVVNGYQCDVYKYTDEFGSDVTAWVWQEKVFPVKMQIEGAGVRTQVVFSDIKINEHIADSKFLLPSGVKVVDMTNLKGMFQAFQD